MNTTGQGSLFHKISVEINLTTEGVEDGIYPYCKHLAAYCTGRIGHAVRLKTCVHKGREAVACGHAAGFHDVVEKPMHHFGVGRSRPKLGHGAAIEGEKTGYIVGLYGAVNVEPRLVGPVVMASSPLQKRAAPRATSRNGSR